MIVVSDATPLNVLIRLGVADLLPRLYGQVVIPPGVESELSHANTPLVIRAWLENRPAWLQVISPSHVDSSIVSGVGECQAINLALELHADFLLVDDKEARTAARRLGLRITGTLGILELGADNGFVELVPAINRLREIGFHIHPQILQRSLERDQARKRHEV